MSSNLNTLLHADSHSQVGSVDLFSVESISKQIPGVLFYAISKEMGSREDLEVVKFLLGQRKNSNTVQGSSGPSMPAGASSSSQAALG